MAFIFFPMFISRLCFFGDLPIRDFYLYFSKAKKRAWCSRDGLRGYLLFFIAAFLYTHLCV